jgi:hypothetical protein
MDLTMPHMDDAETFGELRRLNTDVPGAHPEGRSLQVVLTGRVFVSQLGYETIL